MKLQSTQAELKAIRTICDAEAKLSGRLLASVTRDHFNYSPCAEAIHRIQILTQVSGEVPSYDVICADPAINEDSRKILLKSQAVAASSVRTMDACLSTLDKYYRLRKLYTLSTDVYKRLEQDKVDVEDAIDAAADQLASIRLKSDLTQQLFHIGRSNNTTGLVKRILDKTRKNFIPTGFKSFDNKNGGFFEGSLIVLGGSTGAGKSSLAIALLINMTRIAGANCVYVPLEMTEEETATRILANVSGVPLTKINQKKLTKNEEKKVIHGYKKFVSDLKKQDCRYTIFSPEEDLTIEEIMLLLKPYGYKVIIIDYISLLKGVDGDDSWQQLGKVARFCKMWAKNNNCVVILLAQVSEEGKIRYARAVGEHASNAWTWVATDETRDSGLLQIKQFKARNQQMFPFELRFDPELMRITDVDDKEISNDEETDTYMRDLSDSDEEE